MRSSFARVLGFVVLALMSQVALATETENNVLRILPAAAAPALDGSLDGWTLSGGVFVCGDVENSRDKVAVWFHAMYDADNLYLLARFADPTPLNNPGVTSGDAGFAGDSLQVRIITAPDSPDERTSHLTAWRGRDGKDVIDVAYGKGFNQGKLRDAKTEGARQAFRVNEDQKGYVQVIAMPWRLLAKQGTSIKAGDRLGITLEPNFTIGGNGRMSIKDLFKAGVAADRVFAFMASQCWGGASLETDAHIDPAPVRLADARQFAVRMESGKPVVDWTGVVKSRELRGFKPIEIVMPEDGYVSVVINDAQDHVVRELLATEFLTKGPHTIKWDGLTTPNWRTPGEPVPPGQYTWSAIYHTGIGLRLNGWAANGGQTPWDFPANKGNWGGDHGLPSGVTVSGDRVYLGWSSAEAGKALLACDLEGSVQWNNTHGGIAGAPRIAVDGNTVYALTAMDPQKQVNLYRLNVQDGAYTAWAGSDSTDLQVLSPDDLAARAGRIFLAYAGTNEIQVRDGQTGKVLKTLQVPSPKSIFAFDDKSLLVVSAGRDILSMDVESGQAKPAIRDLTDATAVAADRSGKLYVAVGEPDNQVKVFGSNGQPVGEIGRKGGRRLTGAWQSEGMRFISDIAVAPDGKLWVMEADGAPKRVSAWDTTSGKLLKEFFGPTSYGALGGAICPTDPSVMVGQGCEWKLDEKTGRAACVAVITREGMENARFGMIDGRCYLASTAAWAFTVAPVRIYERIGAGEYVPRTVLFYADASGKEMPQTPADAKGLKTGLWVDANGDGQRQDNEITFVDGIVRVSVWYMNITPEMALYAGARQYKMTGLSPCGAPKYDLAHPTKMPATGLGSADGRMVLQVGDYGVANGWFTCYDIASGKKLWQYPDNFVGVHGSHTAPPAETGMIRGSYGANGAVNLPDPIGNVWVIGTNVGEWHLLTERGFYLTRLFQGDPLKVQFPEQALPGAVVDNVPPGLGGEDFGGSVTLTPSGMLCLQAGKTAFWNVEVTGLDSVKAIPGSGLSISPADVELAREMRKQFLTPVTTVQKLVIANASPAFTGDLGADFAGAQVLQFKKLDDAAVRAAAAWDDKNLYLAWEVKDSTPWINGATDPFTMYLQGDTVDFQVGADPKADPNRREAVLGDLRLSIGNLQGKPAAVAYRKVAADKHPHVFSSGVVKQYPMDSVVVIDAARLNVAKRPGGYTVEAAIPLNALGLQPQPGMVLRGDWGVTHGDTAGQRTRLRSYWSNQNTGIVDDAVFELQMEPKNWGQLEFQK